MGKFFYKLYQSISKKKFLSALVFVLFFLGLITLVSKIQFEEDITKLIPINSKNKDFQKVIKTVNFTDKIIVNIQRQPNGSTEDLTQYASVFLDSLNSTSASHIKKIQGKVVDDDIQKTMDFVHQNLPLFLDESDYSTLRGKIKKDSIRAITNRNYKTLVSPSGLIAKKTILKDPLGLSFIALKKLQQLGVGDGFKLKNGFLLSEDEQNLLLFITQKYAANETAQNEEFVDTLYSIQDQLNQQFSSKVQSEYFGATLVAVANARQIKKDIQFTVSIAMTVLLIILILFYKKLALPLILFLPTLFGAVLSMALLFLIRTKISAISLGIGSVLLGVTLDYALHILTHIRNGNSIKNLYKDVAPSILMSSLTTASAFLCLLFLQSQALQDLGIFAAVSVIGASVFALLFIPLVYSKTIKKENDGNILDRIAGFNFHKSKWAIGLLSLFLFTSIFTYNEVIFNKDISKLNYEPQELIEARKRLDALTQINSKSIYLAAYGDNQEEVLHTNDSLYDVFTGLKKENKVKEFSSVGALVHSQKTQKEKIDRWNRFWNAQTIQKTKENLIESGNALGFKANSFEQFYNLLNTDFKSLSLADYNDINAFSVDDYITTKNGFTTTTSLIKVDSSFVKPMKADFAENSKVILIDRQGMNETFLGNLKNDFNRLIGYSVLVVVLLLLLFFRSLSLTLVTSIPIFLTWFLTIGIMGLLNLEFNIFNIIISTFIFGLGIDYSIFITNGLLTEYRTGEKTLSTHKTSIILSVITTILGIGVLIFAKHPALYTISLISLIGIISAMLVAFAIQPQLFKLFIGSQEKRPITLRYLIHSLLSFGYFGLGGLLFSLYAFIVMKLVPNSLNKKNIGFHKMVSKLMKSVLYTNPFVSKKVINTRKESFEKPVMIIANHTSFLDIISIGMLHPKIVYLVNDWVYNSPIFGSAAKLAGAYPVSGGLENGEQFLKQKVAQGFSLIAFPEGTRSKTNKIRRFHKGAFYLAEQLQLDILPVLIHGNSEVLPKGSFIIKDGSITLKILDRIPFRNNDFGNGYRERTKNIGAYFKSEFQKFREEIEDSTYFHKMVLEDFRYKGDAVFNNVRQDLKINKDMYKTVLNTIGKRHHVVHLSKDFGQLDFLLALDSPDRRINRYIQDQEYRGIFKNSLITHKYQKLKVVETLEEVLSLKADVLIINLDQDINELPKQFIDEITILILLNSSAGSPIQSILDKGFRIDQQKETLIIFNRNDSL